MRIMLHICSMFGVLCSWISVLDEMKITWEDRRFPPDISSCDVHSPPLLRKTICLPRFSIDAFYDRLIGRLVSMDRYQLNWDRRTSTENRDGIALS